jgi:hypothetical protein
MGRCFFFFFRNQVNGGLVGFCCSLLIGWFLLLVEKSGDFFTRVTWSQLLSDLPVTHPCALRQPRERERERERGRMNTLALVFLAKEKLESIYFFILLYLYYYALLIELSRLARSFVFKEGLFFCFFGGWVITPI